MIRLTHILANTLDRGAQWMVVHLLAHLGTEFSCSVVSLREKKGSGVEERLAEIGVPVIYLSKADGPDIRAFTRMKAAFRELKPDIVHTHRIALRYAAPVAKIMGIPHVHTVHSPLEDSTSSLERLLIRVLFHIGVKPVTVAHGIKTGVMKIARLDSHDVQVVPNGIPVGAFTQALTRRSQIRDNLGFKTRDIVFVCVARLAYPKNQKLLIRAFGDVVAKNPTARLLVVGSGPDRSSLEQMTAEYGLGDHVAFLGTRDDVPDILAASDVFVLTSEWEGYPMSLLEAAAAGLPAVSTDVGAVSEIVDHGTTGLLVAPGDQKALGTAMNRLAGEHTFRKACALAASNRAQLDFGLQKMADLYANLYRGMLG